jgi:hypothetical protein
MEAATDFTFKTTELRCSKLLKTLKRAQSKKYQNKLDFTDKKIIHKRSSSK